MENEGINKTHDDNSWPFGPISVLKIIPPIFWAFMINDPIREGENVKLETLIQACLKGDLKKVELILKFPRKDDGVKIALPYACEKGDPEIVKALLNDERGGFTTTDKTGRTALAIACEAGHVEVVKVILKDPRVDVNEKTINGVTPLHLACFYERTEIVEILLKFPGIVTNCKNNYGSTPLDIAKLYKLDKIVTLLEKIQ